MESFIDNPIKCYRRRDCTCAWQLTPENAQSILDAMGYSDYATGAVNIYGTEAYGKVTDTGIEYGNRFGHNKANFGDFILDYDGRKAWAVYTPQEFRDKYVCIAD